MDNQLVLTYHQFLLLLKGECVLGMRVIGSTGEEGLLGWEYLQVVLPVSEVTLQQGVERGGWYLVELGFDEVKKGLESEGV